MAYVISSKFPVDTLPDVAVGVSIPFSGVAVFNQTYLTKDQIKSNLINFFLTNKGERYLNPNFGGNLRKLLFKAIDSNSLDTMEIEIKQQLRTLFPNITINNLDIVAHPTSNMINITLDYQVLNQSPDNIQVNFSTDAL
jgi:phage baseplate assembly protein W